MPRDGQGVYARPAGTAAEPNTTITSTQFNSTVDDIVADLNAARPVSAGGSGGTSAAAARTNLELLRATEGVSDFTAGRALQVGSGGLLGNALVPGATNCNDIVTGERWAIPSSFTNAPTTGSGLLEVMRRASNRYVQTFTRNPSFPPRQWVRSYDGASWSAWYEVALATVTENGNGVAVQYSNGRMVCTHAATFTSSIDTGLVGGFRSSVQTWTFPATFAALEWASVEVVGFTAFGAAINARNLGSLTYSVTSPSSLGTSTSRSVVLRAEGTY